MSKKHTKTSTLGGSIIGGSLYTGNATNQFPTITTTGKIYTGNSSSNPSTIITTSGNTAITGITLGLKNKQTHAIGFGLDGTLYSEEGHLYWESSDGTVQKLTFTKQEKVQQIIDDL